VLPGDEPARLRDVELRLPLPGLGESWGTRLFLDGARIGDFEGTFQPDGSEAGRGAFVGTGLGLDPATPVGPLRLGVRYKLNPSPLDVRRPADVLDALLDARPIESAPARRLQRFHVHLSIGQAF
jgi:outer membrane protein assembly factor BamA